MEAAVEAAAGWVVEGWVEAAGREAGDLVGTEEGEGVEATEGLAAAAVAAAAAAAAEAAEDWAAAVGLGAATGPGGRMQHCQWPCQRLPALAVDNSTLRSL